MRELERAAGRDRLSGAEREAVDRQSQEEGWNYQESEGELE